MARNKKDSNVARNSVDSSVNAERTPPDIAAHPQRFTAEELVGESEYSTREAGEREAERHARAPGGPPKREPLAASPDALGRRYLEDATQSPGPEDLDPDPDPDAEHDDAHDLEQSATRVDARRDNAADPLRQLPARRRS